jgi:hypothetical protein
MFILLSSIFYHNFLKKGFNLGFHLLNYILESIFFDMLQEICYKRLWKSLQMEMH